ncbi:MAG: substrate-binding domain-containing protein [Terriglobales bacterium]
MPRLRLFLVLVSVALFVLPLINCGSEHSADELYVLVSANIQVPYWRVAGAGFSQSASQLTVRYEFVGPDEYDPKAEKEAFDKALTKKPTGILVSAADVKLLRDSIDKAIDAGIPVITIDSDVPDSKRLFFIGTNNYQAGLTGGERLATELKGKGNVVVFTMPGQINLADRLRGYRDALASHPQIKIARVVDIAGDPRIVFDTTTEILGKERNKIDAFVCLEAQGGKEVATVLSSNKVTDKVVIAMDTDPDTLEWVRKGVIAATISQKPYTMTYFGLRMLDDLYHHKLTSLTGDWSKDSFAPVPTFVDTGSSLVDKSNVENFIQMKQAATGAQK